MLVRVQAGAVLAMLGKSAFADLPARGCARSLASLASLDAACARWGEGSPFAHLRARRRRFAMLRIYDVMVRVLEEMREVLPRIAKSDRSLEDQLRRASTSVLLNLAEGSGSRGGNRRLRYCTALGSARECQACLHAASALGYVTSIAPSLDDGLREVVGTLVKVVR